MSEPRIQIGSHVLTDAQAMAVRVAVTNFQMETAASSEFAAELGPIAPAYHARLTEVLRLMFNDVAKGQT